MTWSRATIWLSEKLSMIPKKYAALEERMNAKQQEYKTVIAQLVGETQSAMERLGKDMSNRYKLLLLAIFGMIVLATTFLDLLIKLN